jgi:hypothetical protein
MKVLLVTERDDLKEKIGTFLHSFGTEIIQYWNPIKAMDNLDETAPDAVIFSARDFPRHWKIFLVFLRAGFSKEKVPFILLKGGDFDFDEASKATILNANAILDENLDNPDEIARIKDILSRYEKIDPLPLTPTHTGSSASYVPTSDDRIDLLFTHPENYFLVRGVVKELTASNLLFQPSFPEKTRDLTPSTIISSVSFRIGELIRQVDLKVVENSGDLLFRFIDPPKEILELTK